MSGLAETSIKFAFTAGCLYIILAIVGILLNTYVLVHLIKLAIKDYNRFKRGCGLPLAAMSVSDLSSLVSIILVVVIAEFMPQNILSDRMHSVHCKITIYMIHTLTGFSTWCWLFISTLRYLAVYHPLYHISRNALGPRTIVIMIFIMLSLNSWLFVVIFYSRSTRTCEEGILGLGANWNRTLHGLELFWSYLLPAFLTLFLDIKVVLVRPPSFASNSSIKRSMRLSGSEKWEDSTENKIINVLYAILCIKRQVRPKTSIVIENYQTKNNCNSWQSTYLKQGRRRSTRRGHKTVRHWLAITTLHLLLNAPDNITRLINVITAVPREITPISSIIYLLVRLLYFVQFCFNAAYLSAIIYRRSINPERRNTLSKSSNINFQTHLEYSRPQTRVGIHDESRRQSRSHVELFRRYSADPRALRQPTIKYHTHLQVNQPLHPASSYSSIGTFKSEDIELSSQESRSTNPRNENNSYFSNAPYPKV